MAETRHYWFWYVKDTLKRYPRGLTAGTMQSDVALKAVENTLDETKKMPDGGSRIKLIEMVYFDKTHTIQGAADYLHVSRRTAQRWSIDFVYATGHNMGF